MVDVINNYRTNVNSRKMGTSAFYITDDVFATEVNQYTKCSKDFHDGGF